MCGIVAIVRRPSRRPPPPASEIAAGLEAARSAMASTATLGEAAEALEAVQRALAGTPGIRALLNEHDLVPALEAGLGLVDDEVARLEAALDAGQLGLSTDELETLNATIVRIKDASWSLGHDRIPAARAVASLAWPGAGDATIDAYASIHSALSSIDRLEVRGRDSAGLHVLVEGHGLDFDDEHVKALLDERTADPLFTSMAVRVPGGRLAFVYKAAAEIGELGDNTRALRTALGADSLLQMALAAHTARATVLGHTRWASVGIISQANAHPLNHEEEGDGDGPYVVAALNGDVDNYAELIAAAGLHIPAAFTTDAKVIPALVSRRLRDGAAVEDAFLATVSSFEGSTAVAAVAADAPDRLLLALRGSGQALYVGLGEDSFVVASEPYGLVEETAQYLRMDGESRPPHGGPPGQLVVLDAAAAGSTEGVTRRAYDGTPLPVSPGEVRTAEITTRDIDRGGYAHFLLKEITEAPSSFRKTLRGKIAGAANDLHVVLGDETLPSGLRARLKEGSIRRVRVIGQGTAVVAGHSLAAALADRLAGAGVAVDALPATELSGFGLEDDMSDTLVVAISQSGTTTDTNRTVDLVRARRASVVAIVNRRDSDLVQRADGVLYTSDGRDVEMAVPSTKAFYAQVAAGFLLAVAVADEMGCTDRRRASELLAALRELPAAMEGVLAQRDAIAAAASRHAPSRRHWAVVGNGPNRVAAAEVRIKLSELCYKSIACDATEDKKHVDLSAEPMILVCAAGLSGPNADDVAKEVAIYRAHRAAPVVIATAGEASRYSAALDVLEVPPTHPELGFVLSAMAGHLFGYEAALAIDAQARPFREARAAVESVVSSAGEGDEGDDLLHALAPRLDPPASRFLAELRAGAYDGTLQAATAVRLASLLRFAREQAPLEAYELELGKVGTPSVVIQDLTDALTRAIEELTRPVDAIKHQAKTVTVGISRSEEALFRAPLVRELLAAGASRDRLGYRALRTLAAIDRAVTEVTGYTRYRIEGSVADGAATIHVVDRGGVALDIASRVNDNPQLLGTKHRAATEREVTVARGRRDGRTFVLVPETKDTQVVGMTLLHAQFHDRLAPADAQRVLQGYRDRYDALVDAVTETEPAFDEGVLGEVAVIDLLTEPVHVLADRWRR